MRGALAVRGTPGVRRGPRARRTVRRVVAGLVTGILGFSVLGCGADRAGDRKVVTVWTVLTGEIDMRSQRAGIAAFERDHPDYQVNLVPKPNPGGAPNGDLTTMVAAVRGGVPPDVFVTDRFAIAQQASVGLLENLQPRIDEEAEGRDGKLTDDYLAFVSQEAEYEGDTYGLPLDVGNRGLFYNKTMLREAGIDPDVLDPRHGPPTIEKVLAIGRKLDKTDANGNYTQMGFIPWDGQAFNATWGLLRGAKYFDNATCELVPTERAFLETYQDFEKWSKMLGYRRVQAFLATYRPPDQPPNQSPFLTGKLAMAVDTNYYLTNVEKYAPDLDYGVTYLPVQKEDDPPFNWAGGFGMVQPKGARNAEAGWKLMKYLAGERGQRAYTSKGTYISPLRTLARERTATDELGIFADSLEYTVSRPPLPVAAAFDGAMATAQEATLSGEMSAEEALRSVYDRVGQQMKQFCPFRLPPQAVGYQ